MKNLMIYVAIICCLATGCQKLATKTNIDPEDHVRCPQIDLTRFDSIPEKSVIDMAERFRKNVKTDPEKFAVQQIYMDGRILYNLMCRTDSIKMISGVRENDTLTTVIVQFKKSNKARYYNIDSLFKNVDMLYFSSSSSSSDTVASDKTYVKKARVCPPPTMCRFY